jgi:hypothetical protein
MIDEEIRASLEVDPSPEFVARVRGRIAAEAAPSAWRWSRGLAGGFALAAIVLLAIVVSRSQPNRAPTNDVVQAFKPAAVDATQKPEGTTEPAPDRKEPVRQNTPRAIPAHRSATAVAMATAPAGLKGSRSDVSEVVLDPRETRALRQLIASVRDGRIDLTAARNSASPAPAEIEAVADIAIAPISIEPIAPVAGAEGVRP